MIHKVEGYKNGYVFSNTKYAETNDEMFQKILEKYRKSPKGLRCLICNSTTAKNFKVGILSNSIITINNKIADGCFLSMEHFDYLLQISYKNHTEITKEACKSGFFFYVKIYSQRRERTMWKEYNPNPLGKRVGDCAIRAISAAENLSWFDAYDVLTHYGRLLGNLPNANDVWGVFLRDRGYKRHIIPDTCPDCYTVADFCRDHPKGIYVLGTGSHAIAVIDGNHWDAFDSSSEVPTYYWEAQHDL